jgi:aldose 1-epimerase
MAVTLGIEPIDDLTLRVPGRSVLQSDARGLPPALENVEGTAYDFQRPRRIGSTRLDHAFTDLKRDQDGLARVEFRDPDRGLQVSLWVDQSYRYLMIFTGDSLPNFNRRSVAVEPMTCPPNAFRSGEDLVRLEPGASLTSIMGHLLHGTWKLNCIIGKWQLRRHAGSKRPRQRWPKRLLGGQFYSAMSK